MQHVLDTIESAFRIYPHSDPLSRRGEGEGATIVLIFTEEETRAQNSSNWLKATG